MKSRNYYELTNLFKVVDFDPIEDWCDPNEDTRMGKKNLL